MDLEDALKKVVKEPTHCNCTVQICFWFKVRFFMGRGGGVESRGFEKVMLEFEHEEKIQIDKSSYIKCVGLT